MADDVGSGAQDEDSDDEDFGCDAATANDPCLNRCLCLSLILVVVLGGLVATRTTIFDKMLGHPLSATEFWIILALSLTAGCGCVAFIQVRISRAARRRSAADAADAGVEPEGQLSHARSGGAMV